MSRAFLGVGQRQLGKRIRILAGVVGNDALGCRDLSLEDIEVGHQLCLAQSPVACQLFDAQGSRVLDPERLEGFNGLEDARLGDALIADKRASPYGLPEGQRKRQARFLFDKLGEGAKPWVLTHHGCHATPSTFRQQNASRCRVAAGYNLRAALHAPRTWQDFGSWTTVPSVGCSSTSPVSSSLESSPEGMGSGNI